MTNKEYALIDKQVKEWLDTTRQKKVDGSQIRPVITISSEWGTGANKIAQKLKEKLGPKWNVWDREIISEIAKRAEVRDEIVKSIEDNIYSSFESFFKSFFGGETISQNEYRRHVTRILLAIGHHGYAIIMGRGANFILPRSLRVRLVASRKARLNSIEEGEKVTEEEALFLLRQSDYEKAEFIKNVFNEDINAPWNYDLSIKTNYLRPDTIVDMIITGAKDKLETLK